MTTMFISKKVTLKDYLKELEKELDDYQWKTFLNLEPHEQYEFINMYKEYLDMLIIASRKRKRNITFLMLGLAIYIIYRNYY
jgi:hypothetical protein